jgi:hypothetical protein
MAGFGRKRDRGVIALDPRAMRYTLRQTNNCSNVGGRPAQGA